MWHIIAMGAGKRFSARVAAGDDPALASLAALAVAEEFAREAGFDERGGARLAVVVEELVSNAIRHGAGGGAIAIDLTLSADANEVALTLSDSGVAFDPTTERAFTGPDAETGGGVGLALIKAWANGLHYCRENGRNVLNLRLRLN
ncbi:ATP-binding protein [Novosphingobium sp. Gsoil 351]|uniref:ATP-binding protein n=1 Tax=Novosphingobium sp. Gsoil 351 TaxID=2675225 RepID=UPI0012B4A83D|nr:ATP-binding protein [Novosphingobium sp. Gsoil 351]QGN53816.1 ATP-binding protein [Novosphingobium sp. Gsoil 351]